MVRPFSAKEWVDRARDVGAALATRPAVERDDWTILPPATATELEQVSDALGRHIPASLRDFIETGSAGLDCYYSFESDPLDVAEREAFRQLLPGRTGIDGGPAFGRADQVPQFLTACESWATMFDELGQRERAAQWRMALPIIHIANGDYIALGVSSNLDDPPVVYLSHEGDGATLADSLGDFFLAWERVLYAGPEIWVLDEFRNEQGRFMPTDAQSNGIRRLLLGM